MATNKGYKEAPSEVAFPYLRTIGQLLSAL